MNIVYRDVWSADAAIAAQNPDIDMLYTDLTTALPTSIGCAQDWSPNCRSVINYETVIHPLWSQPRLVFDDVGNPVIDPVTGLQQNNNCLNCHTPVDAAGVVRVPAGQRSPDPGRSS